MQINNARPVLAVAQRTPLLSCSNPARPDQNKLECAQSAAPVYLLNAKLLVVAIVPIVLEVNLFAHDRWVESGSKRAAAGSSNPAAHLTANNVKPNLTSVRAAAKRPAPVPNARPRRQLTVPKRRPQAPNVVI